jgi:hypothetical protein
METLSLSNALDLFWDHQTDIVSACQINLMQVIRSNQPAKELDPEAAWTHEDITAGVNRERIARDSVALIRTINMVNRRNAPVVLGKITDAMIERAREYPVDELLEFNRGGMAICLWHDDTKASLYHSVSRNRVHCFVCEKDTDAIGIVMEQDRCKFPQAVKRLCNQ